MNIEPHNSGSEPHHEGHVEHSPLHGEQCAPADIVRVSTYLQHLMELPAIDLPRELQSYAQVESEYRKAFTSLLADALAATDDLPMRNKALVISGILGQLSLEHTERERLANAMVSGLQATSPMAQVHLTLNCLQHVISNENSLTDSARHLASFLESKGKNLDEKTMQSVERLLQQHPALEQAILPELWQSMKDGGLSGMFFLRAVSQFRAAAVDKNEAPACAKTLAEILRYEFSGDPDVIEDLKQGALLHLYSMKEGALAALPELVTGIQSQQISADVCTYVSDVLARQVASIPPGELIQYKEFFEQQLLETEQSVLPEDALNNVATLVAYGALRSEEFRSLLFAATIQGRVDEESFAMFMEAAQGLYDDEVVKLLLDIPFDDHGSQAEQTLIAGCAHLGPIGFQSLEKYLNPETSIYLLKRVIPPFVSVAQEENELAYSQAASCCPALGGLVSHKYLEVRYHAVSALGNLSSDYDDVRRINRSRLIRNEEDASEIVTKWIWKVRRAADRACVAIRKRTDPFESS